MDQTGIHHVAIGRGIHHKGVSTAGNKSLLGFRMGHGICGYAGYIPSTEAIPIPDKSTGPVVRAATDATSAQYAKKDAFDTPAAVRASEYTQRFAWDEKSHKKQRHRAMPAWDARVSGSAGGPPSGFAAKQPSAPADYLAHTTSSLPSSSSSHGEGYAHQPFANDSATHQTPGPRLGTTLYRTNFSAERLVKSARAPPASRETDSAPSAKTHRTFSSSQPLLTSDRPVSQQLHITQYTSAHRGEQVFEGVEAAVLRAGNHDEMTKKHAQQKYTLAVAQANNTSLSKQTLRATPFAEDTPTLTHKAHTSTYAKDHGRHAFSQRAAPLPEHPGPSSTHDLAHGTTKKFAKLAGYGGFLPSSSQPGDANTQAHSSTRANTKDFLSFGLHQYRHHLPGFTGYQPESACNDPGPPAPRLNTTSHKFAVSLNDLHEPVDRTHAGGHECRKQFFQGGTLMVSDNGRANAEMYFKNTRPMEGYPAMAYPSKTAVAGHRFGTF